MRSYEGTACTEGEQVKDLKSCGWYFECIKGEKIRKSCPFGQDFSSKNFTCYTTLGAENCGARTLSQIECTKQGSKVPIQDECQKYKVCQNGSILTYSCPDSMYFNCWTGECETVIQPSCCSSAVQSVGLCPNNGEKFGHLEQCHDYYVCVDHLTAKKSCGEEYFDPWTKTCVRDGNQCAGNSKRSICDLDLLFQIPIMNWALYILC